MNENKRKNLLYVGKYRVLLRDFSEVLYFDDQNSRVCVCVCVSVWSWIIHGQMEDSERNGKQQEHEKSRCSGNGHLSQHFINFLSTINHPP